MLISLRHLVQTTFRPAMVSLAMSNSRSSLTSQQLRSLPGSLAGTSVPNAVSDHSTNSRPSAISIAIGQTITLSTFVNRLPHDFSNGLTATMIATGLTNSSQLALSPKDLDILRATWNLAIARTMFLALAMVCMAVPCTLAMEWLNAKQIAQVRAAESDSSQEERTAHSLSEWTGSKSSL